MIFYNISYESLTTLYKKLLNFFLKFSKKHFFLIFIFFSLNSSYVLSYPYATYVMDARTGKTLYSQNSNQKMHPASLTKMMTLYLTFRHVEMGKVNLDELIKISSNAQKEPPSKMGYYVGQKVSIRYLIRSAAIRSANDSATALGEMISGNEKKFANYMNLTAKAMGMKNTTFKNANGLTASGHLSTAEDMAILSRRLIYDFPEYYHLFGKNSVLVDGKKLYNTNRKLLSNYSGADGIKTGFTSAAGYNLAASAKKGNKRVIAVIFGSGSLHLRTKRVTELLDIGFAKSKKNVSLINLKKLDYNINMATYSSKDGVINSSFVPLKRPIMKKDKTLNEKNIYFDKKQDFGNNYSPPLLRPYILYIKLKKSFKNETFKINQSEKKEKLFDIQIGAFGTEYNAKRKLSKIILNDFETLSNVKTIIKTGVINKKKVFRVNFIGLSKHEASKACERQLALNQFCDIIEAD